MGMWEEMQGRWFTDFLIVVVRFAKLIPFLGQEMSISGSPSDKVGTLTNWVFVSK